jgi:hygromycin-B 7''-O-kinase
MELNSQIIESILSKRYAEPRVSSIAIRDGGAISKVVEINCSQPRADFIMKIYPDQFNWKMKKELFVYELLSTNISIPMPVILLSDDSKTVLTQNYVLMEKIDGEILSKFGAELEPSQLREIYRQLGGALRAIHSISLESFGYISNGIIDPHPNNHSYMTHQFRKKLSEFSHLGGKQSTHDTVKEFLSDNSYLFKECPSAVLCHNDYHEGNFLLNKIDTKWKLTGVIDVENALAGDPFLDIAKMYYYAIHDNTDKEQGFWDGYGRVSVPWKQRLNIYKLYHALELWDWFASIGSNDVLQGIEADLVSFSTEL